MSEGLGAGAGPAPGPCGRGRRRCCAGRPRARRAAAETARALASEVPAPVVQRAARQALAPSARHAWPEHAPLSPAEGCSSRPPRLRRSLSLPNATVNARGPSLTALGPAVLGPAVARLVSGRPSGCHLFILTHSY